MWRVSTSPTAITARWRPSRPPFGAAQAATSKPIAIMGDLQGPKIRIGELAEPLMLAPGAPLRLATRPDATAPTRLDGRPETATVFCDYPQLTEDLGPNDRHFPARRAD